MSTPLTFNKILVNPITKNNFYNLTQTDNFVKIGSSNIQLSSNLSLIHKILENYDILFIQEVRFPKPRKNSNVYLKFVTEFSHNGHSFISHSANSLSAIAIKASSKLGVVPQKTDLLTFINPHFRKYVASTVVEIHSLAETWLCISVYAPVHNSKVNKVRVPTQASIFHDINNAITAFSNSTNICFKVIMGGDFNNVTDNKLDVINHATVAPRQFRLDERQALEELHTICANHNM